MENTAEYMKPDIPIDFTFVNVMNTYRSTNRTFTLPLNKQEMKKLGKNCARISVTF